MPSKAEQNYNTLQEKLEQLTQVYNKNVISVEAKIKELSFELAPFESDLKSTHLEILKINEIIHAFHAALKAYDCQQEAIKDVKNKMNCDNKSGIKALLAYKKRAVNEFNTTWQRASKYILGGKAAKQYSHSRVEEKIRLYKHEIERLEASEHSLSQKIATIKAPLHLLNKQLTNIKVDYKKKFKNISTLLKSAEQQLNDEEESYAKAKAESEYLVYMLRLVRNGSILGFFVVLLIMLKNYDASDRAVPYNLDEYPVDQLPIKPAVYQSEYYPFPETKPAFARNTWIEQNKLQQLTGRDHYLSMPTFIVDPSLPNDAHKVTYYIGDGITAMLTGEEQIAIAYQELVAGYVICNVSSVYKLSDNKKFQIQWEGRQENQAALIYTHTGYITFNIQNSLGLCPDPDKAKVIASFFSHLIQNYQADFVRQHESVNKNSISSGAVKPCSFTHHKETGHSSLAYCKRIPEVPKLFVRSDINGLFPVGLNALSESDNDRRPFVFLKSLNK